MKILDHLEEWLIASLMALATVIIFIAVVHRYLSGFAIPGVQDALIRLNTSWAQEVCIIMFVWMAKFGAAYGVRTGIHVGVDVMINRLSSAWRRKFIVFGLLAGAFFTSIIAVMGASLVVHVQQGGTTTDVLEMPQWIVYLAIPLGSGLMCFRFLQVTWQFLTTGELPKHDHSRVEGLGEEIAGAKV